MRVFDRSRLLAGLLVLGGCQGPPSVPPPAYPPLGSALGPSWTLVPLPSGALLPGAIVRLQTVAAAANGAPGAVALQWIGTLQACGVPDAALAVVDAPLASVASGATFGLDASVGAQLAHISGALGVDASSTANLTINASTDTTLDYVTFQRWAGDPAHAQALSQACGTILAQPGMAVVQEAFVISSGSYIFQTTKGARIELSPPAGVPVQAGVQVTAGTQGSVTITQKLAFALRLLQPLPQGGFALQPLATSHALRGGRPLAGAVGAIPAPIQLGGMTITGVLGLPSR